MVTFREYLEKLFSWIDINLMQVPTKAEPQPFFTHALMEIEEFDKFADNHICPNCRKKEGFKIEKYERGTVGWELNVSCAKCGFAGTLNTTGFRFEVRR